MSHILIIQNISNHEILTWKGSVTTHGPDNLTDAGESMQCLAYPSQTPDSLIWVASLITQLR